MSNAFFYGLYLELRLEVEHQEECAVEVVSVNRPAVVALNGNCSSEDVARSSFEVLDGRRAFASYRVTDAPAELCTDSDTRSEVVFETDERTYAYGEGTALAEVNWAFSVGAFAAYVTVEVPSGRSRSGVEHTESVAVAVVALVEFSVAEENFSAIETAQAAEASTHFVASAQDVLRVGYADIVSDEGVWAVSCVVVNVVVVVEAVDANAEVSAEGSSAAQHVFTEDNVVAEVRNEFVATDVGIVAVTVEGITYEVEDRNGVYAEADIASLWEDFLTVFIFHGLLCRSYRRLKHKRTQET